MAFSDILYLLVLAFGIIVVSLVGVYIYDQIYPKTFQGQINPALETKINNGLDNNIGFFNLSFITIFLVIGFISVILSAYVSSNPLFLVAWIFINLILLFVYDTMFDALSYFIGSTIDDGSMDSAIAFFNGGLPKSIPILNVLVAIALFGKRVFT
jgi:hypothetical protein